MTLDLQIYLRPFTTQSVFINVIALFRSMGRPAAATSNYSTDGKQQHFRITLANVEK